MAKTIKCKWYVDGQKDPCTAPTKEDCPKVRLKGMSTIFCYRVPIRDVKP
jgi:hypothetical protein